MGGCVRVFPVQGKPITNTEVDMSKPKKPAVQPAAATKDEWDRIVYDGITADENEEIRIARRAGFAEFLPSSEAQGRNTLKAAREFLVSKNSVNGKPLFTHYP